MTLRRYEIVLYRREPQLLSLDALAAHAGVHPSLIEQFVQFGLIEPIERRDTTLFFDDAAVPRLRTIRRLRESLGINLPGVAVVLDLLDKFCALQRENERLRARL